MMIRIRSKKDFKIAEINVDLRDMIYAIGTMTGRQGEIIKYDRMFQQHRLIVKEVESVKYTSLGVSQQQARKHIKRLYLEVMGWEEIR